MLKGQTQVRTAEGFYAVVVRTSGLQNGQAGLG